MPAPDPNALPAVDEHPRTGLTLSGGGFRATLFHLGVVRFLYEEKLLPKITHIFSVSGGSILAAHLVLNWNRYTSENPEEFDAAARELLDFIRSDPRGRVLRPWLASWAALGLPRVRNNRWWRTNLLQREYDRLCRGARMCDLVAEGRPQLHLLTTSFTTGHLVAFGNREMRFCHELDSTRPLPQPEFIRADDVPVALAIAASSAFPPLFPPVRVSHKTFGAAHDVFPNRHYLTDGGVFDNLGIRRLLLLFKPEERLEMVVVSDAQRALALEYRNDYNLVWGRASRCVDLMMDRVSYFEQEAIEEFINRNKSQLLYCRLPQQAVLDRPYAPTSSEQFAVATARTDLDHFTDDEIDAIVHQGYASARAAAESGGLCGPWSMDQQVWHPARPNRAPGYQLGGIDRRKWGLFRPGHWATWAFWGLLSLWVAIPIGLYLYQYGQAVEAKSQLREAERAAKHVRAVRLLGDVVVSGNPESAERRKREWEQLKREMEQEGTFRDFLGSDELGEVEEAIQHEWSKYPTGTDHSLLKLAKKVRAILEQSGGEFLKIQRSSRAQFYDEVREAVEQIKNPDKKMLNQIPNSRRQFWRLYWGPMVLVEGPEVESAMAQFGSILREWERDSHENELAPSGMKDRLKDAAKKLKAACEKELHGQ